MLFSPEEDVIGDGISSKIGAKWAQDYYQVVKILMDDVMELAIQELLRHTQLHLFGTVHGLVTLSSASVQSTAQNASQCVIPHFRHLD
jgi:hypothetical protein